MSRPTIKDIARLAGVSTPVVSQVLNDRPSGYGNVRVSEAMRRKIKEISDEIGYKPHRAAKVLRTGQNNTIGIISMFSDHQMSHMKIYNICNQVSMHGYSYILQQMENTHPKSFGITLDMLLDYNIAGLVLINLSFEDYPTEEFSRLEQSGLPVVCASAIRLGKFPYVGPDYYKAAFEMSEGVIAKGCNTFLVICEGYEKSPTVQMRVAGIRDACAKVADMELHIAAIGEQVTSYSSIELGYAVTKEHLRSNKSPDVIFYANDFLAFGGLSALKEMRIRVPEDLFIAGFDGLEIIKFTDPPITTAIQPVNAIAEKIVEVLFDIIDGRASIAEENYMIPCEIAFRRSTG